MSTSTSSTFLTVGWVPYRPTENLVSERVVDQRARNRVMESLDWLREGPGDWGAGEYIAQFFDWMPFDKPPVNGTLNEDETVAIARICELMNRVSDATPTPVTDHDLVAGGHLERIKAEAEKTLAVFLKRGRFGEEVEETEPSFEAGQNWSSSL